MERNTYMDAYMTSNELHFMIYWILCQSNVKEIGPKRKLEDRNTSKSESP
jgi:hypothetical protein